MAAIAYSNNELAESAARFAEEITPLRARWEYCASRAIYFDAQEGKRINFKATKACSKVLGIGVWETEDGLRKIFHHGFEGADEFFSDARERARKKYQTEGPARPVFRVGPMQAWNVGHLYFARVESHPHVLKIGFSRRVRERLADIESKEKVRLVARRGHVLAGTLADEKFCHHDWRRYNIHGEWFFDPTKMDRSLPKFLAERRSHAHHDDRSAA